MRKTVVIGILGSRLDAGRTEHRWERWRPTVSMCQQPDLTVDRLELLYSNNTDQIVGRVIEDIAKVAPATVVSPRKVELSDSWDFAEVYQALRDQVRSMQFDPETEDYLVNITTGTHVEQICWFALAETRDIPARLLQLSPGKRGPNKAIGTHRIIDLDLSRYDILANRFDKERGEATDFLKSGIATRNDRFNALIDDIEKVALRSRSPVLLTGPTGAGKSQLARRIFDLKKSLGRMSGAFIEANCATLRGDQAMSTLFGHTKGAFTGADKPRAGLIRSADKGMLFLDEIGELGLDEQAMILRAVEEKCFMPVGSDQEVRSDFVLIAGTNKDLSQEVASGRFRADLLARIDLWTFALPPLKDRVEDIEPNLDFELDRYYQTERRRVSFNREAREAYLGFATSPGASWDANFRDLSASVMRMATLTTSGRIDLDTAKAEIARLGAKWTAESDTTVGQGLVRNLLGSRYGSFDIFDLTQLAAVIGACQNARSLGQAGRTLFAVSRAKKDNPNDSDRLRKFLLRFGLTFEQVRSRT